MQSAHHKRAVFTPDAQLRRPECEARHTLHQPSRVVVTAMAGALRGSLPVAVMCSFFVEYYVSGMTGAVKE